MNIIGIDPGTATMGYGVIKKEGLSITCLEYGIIETSKDLEDSLRLKEIDKELEIIFEKYFPQILAIEKVYFHKNVKTAFPVSQAKGVAMLKAAQKNIPVYQFSPSQIKAAITGYGSAEKMQLQKMIQMQLKLKERPRPNDAADALGAAICGSQKVLLS